MTSSNRDVDIGVVEGCCTRSTGPVGVVLKERSRSYTIVINKYKQVKITCKSSNRSVVVGGGGGSCIIFSSRWPPLSFVFVFSGRLAGSETPVKSAEASSLFRFCSLENCGT